MANPSEKNSNELPIPALASIAFAALAVLAQQLMPLESPRPVTPNSGRYSYQTIEDVNARLWQDPFTAIAQHEASCSDPKKCHADQNHSIEKLRDFISYSIKKPITVLGVMVFGGPSVDNVEWRRRTRYAVLSGLAEQGYAPRDPEHIGYVDRPDRLLMDRLFMNMSEKNFLTEKIPFEWFIAVDDKSSDDKSPVLLLWLDETAFASTLTPLESTKKLVEGIKQIFHDSTFKFIGPTGSDMLQIMINELEKCKPQPARENWQGHCTPYPFEFYDATASGDWPGVKFPFELHNEKSEAKNDTSHLELYLKSLETKDLISFEIQDLSSLITRTGLTDYQLATAIVEELKLRGIEIDPYPLCEKKDQAISRCQRNNEDHIVIISEWDTRYGRESLPKAMKEALVPETELCLTKKKNKSEKGCFQHNWIHSFSYMRGLDGVVPDEGKTKEEDKTKKEKEDTNKTKSVQERPEGQSQKDYLRRLAVRISELAGDLESKGEGHIYAIGVLGSDAYDKLMILKSLRLAFPNAIFFTTNLDTRLMHPDDFNVTRNLVVAASFGLQLNKDIQKSIPPFRDSDQTAHFLATQIALINAKEKKIDQKKIKKFLGKARIFETSHDKAIDLSDVGGNCKLLQACDNVHPSTSRNLPGWKSFIAAFLSVVCVIALAYRLSERCRSVLKKLSPFVRDCMAFDMDLYRLMTGLSTERAQGEMWTRALVFLLPQILTVLVFGVVFFEIDSGNKGEPFYWTAGVSVWPTELIRLVAGILGCIFIAKTATDLECNKRQLSKDFFELYADPVCGMNNSLIIQKKGNTKRVNVELLWNWYCWNTSAQLRNKRVIWTFSFFLVLAFALMYVFGFPNVPYRGIVSNFANNLVLSFCVPVFIFLVMTVIDATWCCVHLIRQLSEYTSNWPSKTLWRFNLRAVDPDPASANGGAAATAQELNALCNKLHNVDNFHLDEWLDIEFIAAHTKVVGKLVYYPIIMLVLMMFARSKVFDNWDMPIGLVLFFLSSAVLSVACAFYLRHEAEKARKNILLKIDDMKIALCLQAESTARSTLKKQVEIITQKISKINEGAFMPFTQEPAFQALLLPLGGWGGVTLLEYFVLKGF